MNHITIKYKLLKTKYLLRRYLEGILSKSCPHKFKTYAIFTKNLIKGTRKSN